MIAGAGGDVATRAEAMLRRCARPAAWRCPGARGAPISWTPRSWAAPPPTASSSTTATGRARCIRAARWCRQCSRSAMGNRPRGKALIAAMVAGYETVTAIGARLPSRSAPARLSSDRRRSRCSAPRWRPASCAAFRAGQLANALGLAASSAAGLFAFVNGGADIKRLHAGHAAREGLQAALLAQQGVRGTAPCARGARRLFASLRVRSRRTSARPSSCRPRCRSASPIATSSPMPCCRHIQPAVEALIGLLTDEKIATEEVERIDTETYRIAAEHAADRLGRFRQRPAELPLPDGARAQVPRHQARAFRRAAAPRSGARSARRQAPCHRAARHRPALSAPAPGARDGDHGARHLHAPGRRSARLAPACRSTTTVCRPSSTIWSRPCSASAAPPSWHADCGRSRKSTMSDCWSTRWR